MGAALKLEGLVFGKLTAIKRQGTGKRKQALWLCGCECGNEHIVPAASLSSGNTTTCGSCVVDLTGQRFGRLTILRYDGLHKGRSCWLCLCDCGQELTVKQCYLVSGGTQSCGCLAKDTMSQIGKRSLNDLVGREFGLLTVLKREGLNKHNNITWMCLCSCGKEVVVRGYNLTQGKTRSCGCLSLRWDITGQRFGRLVVIERDFSIKKLGLWKCSCDCGNTKVVRSAFLRAGRTISCGCAKHDMPGLTSPAIRGMLAAVLARRRTRQTLAGGSYTAAQIEELYRRQKGRCGESSCRKPLRGKFHRDHWVPVAAGGSSDIRNIVILCAPCNLRKGKKDPIAWARVNGRLL